MLYDISTASWSFAFDDTIWKEIREWKRLTELTGKVSVGDDDNLFKFVTLLTPSSLGSGASR